MHASGRAESVQIIEHGAGKFPIGVFTWSIVADESSVRSVGVIARLPALIALAAGFTVRRIKSHGRDLAPVPLK